MKRKKGRRFKEMEKRLHKFKLLEPEIGELKIKIKDIEKDINGCKAINYSGTKTGDTYKFNSSVENEGEYILGKIEPLQKKIIEKELEIGRITNAKKLLDEREEKFFKLYFESMSKKNMSNVASEMHLDRGTCYLVKDEIVFKMIDFL